MRELIIAIALSTMPVLASAEVSAGDDMRAMIADMARCSATFSAQMDRIASSGVNVVVRSVIDMPKYSRAETRMIVSGGKLVVAIVSLRSVMRDIDRHEDLAHEVAHIVERLDGVDVADMDAHHRGRALTTYETDNARRVGRTVAREVESCSSPTFASSK